MPITFYVVWAKSNDINFGASLTPSTTARHHSQPLIIWTTFSALIYIFRIVSNQLTSVLRFFWPPLTTARDHYHLSATDVLSNIFSFGLAQDLQRNQRMRCKDRKRSLWFRTAWYWDIYSFTSPWMHCGAKPGRFEIFNHSLSHKPGS